MILKLVPSYTAYGDVIEYKFYAWNDGCWQFLTARWPDSHGSIEFETEDMKLHLIEKGENDE